MKSIMRFLRKKDFGDVGIGSMIVFIAMVLVAGIAASVLIQTAGKLETQAMQSGQQTIAEVATGVAVEKITGRNVSGSIVLTSIEVRPRAGSKDVDLSETVVEISDSDTKNLLTYDSGVFTAAADIDGDVFTFAFYPTTGTQFGIIVLEDADGSCTGPNPVINSGDHVILAVNTSAAFGGLTTRQDISGIVIPEQGSPGVIAFTTPAAFNEAVVELQ